MSVKELVEVINCEDRSSKKIYGYKEFSRCNDGSRDLFIPLFRGRRMRDLRYAALLIGILKLDERDTPYPHQYAYAFWVTRS